MANPEHMAILKQGVDVWNNWREDNPAIIPDLSSLVLPNSDLHGIDFRKVHLRMGNLIGANLCGADLRNANLSLVRLGGANLSDSILSVADLQLADLRVLNPARSNRLSGKLRTVTSHHSVCKKQCKKVFEVNLFLPSLFA